MFKFFHHLFNPHCPECREDAERELYNPLIEELKNEIARLRIENTKLIDRLTAIPKIEVGIPEAPVELKSKTIPWKARRQMLENEDRRNAQILKERLNSIEEIEKEIGIVEEGQNALGPGNA